MLQRLNGLLLNVNALGLSQKEIGTIGLITHQTIAKEVDEHIHPVLRPKIQMLDWFGGSTTRGSNAWTSMDLLIVCATYRMPVECVRERLAYSDPGALQFSDPSFVEMVWQPTAGQKKRISFWGPDPNTEIGEEQVRMIRAELEQCLHRSRMYLENGIPVLLLSKYPSDLPVWERIEEMPKAGNYVRMTKNVGAVLDALAAEGGSVQSDVLSKLTGMKLRGVQALLKKLEKVGLVSSWERGHGHLSWSLKKS